MPKGPAPLCRRMVLSLPGAGPTGLAAQAAGQAIRGVAPHHRIGGRFRVLRLGPDLSAGIAASGIRGNPPAGKANLVTAARGRAGAAVTASPGWRGADPARRRRNRHAVTTAVEPHDRSDLAAALARDRDRTTGFGGDDLPLPDEMPAPLGRGLTLRPGATSAGARTGLAGIGTLRADDAVAALPLRMPRAGRPPPAKPLIAGRQGAQENAADTDAAHAARLSAVAAAMPVGVRP